MTWKLVSAVTLGAALLAASPAQAASCKKDSDCGSGQVCTNGTCLKKASKAASDAAHSVEPTDDTMAGTKRTSYIGWGGLGFYDVSNNGGQGAFGLHVGGAANLLSLTPDLPLIGWADVGIGFPSGGTIFPLKLGAGVRYDRAGPVQLLGGLAFAILPNSGGSTTPLGVGLMGMVLYPLPQVHRNLSVQAQL
ncbi:MAG: hypothetical protein ACXWLR_13685, partial [Myxococcales bacterium]